jgi:NAD(P)-dependent dehydrogenase (short-subunit alcohol dehydrogenase family)
MTSPEMAGRVAIITGTTRGIGLVTAKAFLREGAKVVGCSPAADDLPPSLPDGYEHHSCDVSDPDQVEDLVAFTVGRFGRLDCLVNNAGFHPLQRPIDDFDIADFNAVLATNLVGPFVACKAALPLLRKTKGTIVNVGSTVGLYGQDGSVTYVASKAGLSGLTKALAIDEARHGVRVNCVCPGAILTPAATETHSPEKLRDIARWAWQARMGTAEEVAETILFLASSRSAFITGQDIVIGGGTELGYGAKADYPAPEPEQ